MVYNSLWGGLFSLAVLLSCSFLSLNAFASTHDSAITSRTFAADSVKIYYPSGYRYIVPSYEDNAESLDTLVSKVRLFKDSGNLSEVRITSYSSPDGYYSRNSRLARLRADSLASYIVRHTGVGRDMVTTVPSGIGYGVLKDLVTEDTGVPHRDEVLRILSETPEFTRDSAGQITGGIKTSLLILDKGSSYRYMKEHLFPKLRSGLVVTIIVRKEDPVEPVEFASAPYAVQEAEPVLMAQAPSRPASGSPAVAEPVLSKKKRTSAFSWENSRWSIKTNLPFYALVVPNLAAEFKFADHFSIDVPVYYSPYTVARDYRFRVLALQPSVRYWLKDTMKGHFFGVHLTGGLFNISVDDRKRFQDTDGMWGAGIDYGYALKFNRHWGLEFNIGVGYIWARYDTFYNIDNGALYDTSTANYLGVTRLGISLIYKL